MHSASSPWPGEDLYAERQDLQLLRLLPAHQQFRLINCPVVDRFFVTNTKKMNDRNDLLKLKLLGPHPPVNGKVH